MGLLLYSWPKFLLAVPKNEKVFAIYEYAFLTDEYRIRKYVLCIDSVIRSAEFMEVCGHPRFSSCLACPKARLTHPKNKVINSVSEFIMSYTGTY